mmetsp:Transcript_21426/g.35461  ORF Transcript_21426/g.35461 Transcript_21426/m.35461 type:complete len:810 (-) Transcript_21426:48-2477(-)
MTNHHRLLQVLVVSVSLLAVAHSLECRRGYSDGNDDVRVIPDSWINDGFCDCPLDALDEPNTDACAGAPVGGWAGLPGRMEKSPTFQCPQQHQKKLPLSRLNDGVCDCCDGADEPASTCPDNCNTVLAVERAARAKMQADYVIGSQKRTNELAAFDALVKETMVEIEKTDEEMKGKEDELEGVSQLIHEATIAFAEARRAGMLRVASVVAASDGGGDVEGISGLLDPLTNDEIGLLIQLTCQLSGEMEGSMKERTCVPLRLAGVDAGILWSDEAFKDATANVITMDDDEEAQQQQQLLLAELVYMNTQGEKAWSEKKLTEHKKKADKRRRLDDHYPDDDYDHYDEEDDDDDDDDYGRDDYGRDDDEDDEEEVIEDDSEEEKGEEIKKVKAIVEGTLFSRPRRNFLDHSESLVAKIDAFLEAKKEEAEAMEKEEKEKEEKEKEEGAPEAQSEESETEGEAETEEVEDGEPEFDPMSHNLVKSNLKRRQQAIRRGLQYAVSGHILVDAISANNDDASKARVDLINLAVGTLMHSRASTEHVWQMLSTFLPEFDSTSPDESQTCASPLATICPAKAIERKGVQYPPAAFMTAGDAACSRAVDEINAAGCAEAASDDIPTNVSDGYYGYSEIRARGEDDPLGAAFASLQILKPTLLESLETKERELEEEKSALEKQVKSLEDTIGGRDGQQDGVKGELHGMKDSCHIVTEGKYDYEVCIYGRAAQKDKGSKSSGTSLGQWQGMSIDEETGHRIMKWEKGQQCWNGPARSATVIVRCGAATSVLSAEEPDTCQYALEMESHIACDDAYYQKYLA